MPAWPSTTGADLTELAAAKFIERHGRGALGILEQRAEQAEQLGHRVAAQTWHTMADAAARLLRTERSGTGLNQPVVPPADWRSPARR